MSTPLFLERLFDWRRSGRGVPALLLAALAALFLLAFANLHLWHASWQVLAAQQSGATLLLLAVALWLIFTAILYLLLWPVIGKPLLMLVFVCAALAAYAMDAYGTYIDVNMVGNLMATDWREVYGLLSWELLQYVLLLGVVPSLLLAWLPIRHARWSLQLLFKPLVFVLALLLAGGLLLTDYQQASALGRNHRELRYLINPWMPFYYGYAYFREQAQDEQPFKVIGQDAHLGAPLVDAKKPTLVLLVVGETARAQDFSLDGYGRDTNPELAKRQVFSFRQVQSCGTETAVSLPCMFSPYERKDYSREKALHTSNLLDVLKQAGVTVLWRDNNSGSKGMADRVSYEDVSRSDDPAVCAKDREHCYDGVLLYRLPAWLQQQQAAKPGTNLLVVLHMYGSHGPAYYKRYPAAFARFQPECKTNELSRCAQQDIVNSYDNTILYTDHVLAQMIDFLKQQSGYNTALLYLSDHGESLGEDGLYLHGMPWHLAPEQQRHIPFIWWMSEDYAGHMGLSASCLQRRLDTPLSQDDLFSSVLGMFAVRTQVYDPTLDFLAPCRTP